MKRIGILGTGAMGSVFGGYLALSGADVTFIDPFKAHLDEIKEKGLTLQDKEANINYTIKNIKTSYSAEGLEPFDLVIIMVKGNFSRTALQEAKNIIGEHTYLASFQNGIGNDDILAEFVDRRRILLGCATISAGIVEPGTVYVQKSKAGANSSHAYLYPTIYTPEGIKVAEYLKESFGKNDTVIAVTSDVSTFIWNKSLMNMTLNPLSGILRLKVGQLYPEAYARKIIDKIVEECVSVSEALGIKGVTAEIYYKGMENVMESQIVNHYPSMGQDMLQKNNPTEIEFMNGAVVRYGKEAGIPTPFNEVIYNLVKAIENNYENQYFK